MVEALIDFGEGEDIEQGVYEQGGSTYGQGQHSITNEVYSFFSSRTSIVHSPHYP